jgi:para-nitrobenzyl esterase
MRYMKFALICACLLTAAEAAPLPEVRVDEGMLSGASQGNVTAFLGVPYAAPPVGNLRWRVPQPAQSWKGVRQATAFSANCMQTLDPNGAQPWTHEYIAKGNVSEDCLYLNVWTPADTAKAKLPVMVWIHGGAFMSGSGSVPIYDGAKLAAKGIVVVNINYRLGAFGFLAHPALSAESPQHVSGNYGLLDQIAALTWVRKNIAAFGGDSAHVTIAGQSAGAMSVVDLALTPLAKGLFDAAIAQSGVGIASALPTKADAEKTGEDFAKATGAATAKELRALSAEAVQNAKLPGPGFGLRFAPIQDGWVFPDAPAKLLAEGRYNDTPFLTGQTADEMLGLNPKFGNMTPNECAFAVSMSAGPSADAIAAVYLKDQAKCSDGVTKFSRDRGQAATYMWAATRLKTSKKPIFVYYFAHPEPGPQSARFGAFHSSEIPYVFDTLDASPERPFTDRDRALAETTSSYWVNFVKHDDPNGQGLTAWPAIDPAGKSVLEIGNGIRVRPALDEKTLQLMLGIVAKGGTLSLF